MASRHGKMLRGLMLKLEEDENARTGKVIHTFYGVKFVMDELCDKSNNMSRLTSELIAAAVGGHHGQFDIYDSKGCDGIEHRLNYDIPYDKTFANFCSESLPGLTQADMKIHTSISECCTV